MLAFWEGVRHSATGQMANEPLYQFIFQDLHGGPGTGSDVWDRQLLALMGFRKITETKDLTAADYFRPLPLKQWATPEFDSAMNRGPGMPGSRWMLEDRGISQLAGHENDFVYFQSPLPFIVNDWNRLKLQLTGNEVELFLNNQSVFRRTLEASNMRRFGLFHFPGQTSARVRRVVWTGDWPKQLPALEDQELADIELISKLDEESQAMEVVHVHFFDRQPVLEGFRQNLDRTGGAFSEFQPSPTGLQAIQEGKTADAWRIQALVAPHSLVADFDIIAEYEQLKLDAPTKADKEKFPGVNLTAKLESTPFARVYFHARRNSSGNVFLDTMSEHPLEAGSNRCNVQGFSQETSAGKLRLARRGTSVYYLFANGDSEQFRLYRTQAVPDAPVKANSLELQTLTGGIGRTFAVWKSLTIRAKGMSDVK